jgi:DNA primase
MAIDFDVFVAWAESRFGDVIVSGDEVKLNSIFCEDRKHHLWCSPSGGKKRCETGVYHCWKSDEKGDLVGLVMEVDHCSYEQAVETLNATPGGGLAELERRVNEMFFLNDSTPKAIASASALEIPQDCYLFEDLPSSNRTRSAAEEYLKTRGIPTDGLFVCTAGRYKNRIIIPYRDRAGRLIYYNGRYIGDPGTNLRYLGPPKELGIGKGDVLYSRFWPSKGDKVYIVEGEIDSMSLDLSGLKSVALGGKNLTDAQIDMLKGTKPVVCLDADDSGAQALPRMAIRLKNSGFEGIRYVRPCKEYKDWNGLFVAKGPKILSAYIRTQEKEYGLVAGGDWEGTSMGLNRIFD